MNFLLWINIAAVATLVTVTNAKDFWTFLNCGTVKEQLEANQEISEASDVVTCIYFCFQDTAQYVYEITPDQCFNVLMKPYITKVLKRSIPTDAEIQTCLKSKDRSNCKDTLLYYFTKWFKDHYTPDHYKRFAYFLFHTWAHNPDITRSVGYGDWDHPIGLKISEIRYESDEDIQAAIKITSPSDPLEYPVIHSEIKRHCYKPATDHTRSFCRLRIIMNIAKKIQTLAKGKQQYTDNFQKYVGATTSNFVPFSILFDTYRASNIEPSTNDGKALVLDQQLNELADLTQAGNTQNMKLYLQFMPEPYLLEKACKRTGTFPVVARRCCVLVEVVEQLLIYSEMSERRKESGNAKAITINFSLDLRAVITELRGEEVFKMMLDSRYDSISSQEETESLIEGKFDQLKNYFAKLQSFNMQKARADVGYVKGRIEYYQGKTDKATQSVSEHVGGVLKAALITQGLEVAEKIIKLALAIAEACNPFKVVFNGGTATDILDATSELMQAIANLAEASALKKAWNDVIKKAKEINEGFQKNSEFLSAVGRIVDKIKLKDFPNDDEFEQCKSTFLRLYNAYTPQIDKEMLADLATKFDTSVESGCELINAATGAAASGYVAYVKDGLYCQKAAASTSSLKTIFEEIYDFQFEFIESMASYLQSATGYHASQQMVTLTGKPMDKTGDENKRRSELRANIIMAHVTYEIQRKSVIQTLCDFLEYREAGKTPAVCEGSTTDVPTLLSYIPTRCRSVTKYVSIPITTSSNSQPGYINIKRLYSGEEVSFNIPSYQWMKEHKWISRVTDVEAIYVRSFEVILPTLVRGKKEIEVRVRSMGGNEFEDDGTKYTLIPSDSFTMVYTGGKQFYPCNRVRLENPYSICEDRKLPKLCVMSDVPAFDDAKRLYPTIFSKFKIKAEGVTDSETPDPDTPLDIKANINMCIFEGDGGEEKRSVVEPKPGCCSGNDYWNEEQSSCVSCASGSTANLNGYYCEKNQQALPLSKQKKKSKKKKKSSSSRQ